MESAMHQIFPLSEAACELEERYKDYVAAGGMELHKLLFTLGDPYIVDQLPKPHEWRAYLKAVIDDYLNHVLHWTTDTDSAEKVMDSILPGYIPITRNDIGHSIANRRRVNLLHLQSDTREYEKTLSFQQQLSMVQLPPADLEQFRAQRRWHEDGTDAFDIGRMVMEYVAHTPFKSLNRSLEKQRNDTETRLGILRSRIDHRQYLLRQLDLEEQAIPEIRIRQEHSDKLYENVLAPMIEKVQSWVDGVLDLEGASPTNTLRWHTWLIQDVGDDIDIQMGEDFRILDWLQRTKGGRNYDRGTTSDFQYGGTSGKG
jgi:hypothetical protein